MFADFSCSVASVIVPAGIPFIGVYLIPLNQDGTSYGDGIPGTTGAANTPASSYFIGNIPAPVGTQAVTGMLQRIIIPPGTFKFAIYNGLGVAFTSSSNTFAYRTYNRSVL
jgi:hypothetical protein